MDVPVTSSLSVRFFPVCAFVFFDLCSNGYRKTYNTEFLVSLCAPPHIFDVFNALPTGHRDVDIATSTSRRRLLPTSIHYIAMAPSHRGRGSGRGRGRGRGREGLAAAAREAEAAKLVGTTVNAEEDDDDNGNDDDDNGDGSVGRKKTGADSDDGANDDDDDAAGDGEDDIQSALNYFAGNNDG